MNLLMNGLAVAIVLLTGVGCGKGISSSPTAPSAPVPCSFTVSPTSDTIMFGGGTATAGVTTASTCAWTAMSDVPWMTVTEGGSGTGNGTVTYAVEPIPSTSERTGTLTVAGQTITVTQQAVCSFTVSPTSQAILSVGGTATARVTTFSYCAWTATASATWIRVTDGASGSGNGTVTYSADPNLSSSARTGTLSVAGQTITITQTPSVTFSFAGTVSPGSGGFAGVAPGTRLTGTYTFDPTAPPMPTSEPTRVSYFGVIVQFTVGSELVTGNDPFQARIEIHNGPPQGDSYSLVALGGFRSGTIAGRTIDQFLWVVSGTASLFSDTSLPRTPTFFGPQLGSRVCIAGCGALEGSITALTLAR